MGLFSSEKWEDEKKEEEQRTKWLEITDEEISKEIENLDNTDYTILETYKQDNMLLGLHIGLEKQINSFEKLLRCKLIKKLDREMTFSEKEKFERQKDTPQYKQYLARINRIMDKKMTERLKEFASNIGFKSEYDPIDLTEKGKQVLLTKRKEVESVWQKIRSAFDGKNKQLFREEVDKNKTVFPLFLIMGFANGAMMGTMMGNMGMNSASFMQDMDMAYNEGYADGSAGDIGGDYGGEGGDFGDTGGDGGGFMDGGMSVGM